MDFLNSGGAIRLSRQTGRAGDPSLRMKNGYAQDDAEGRKPNCTTVTQVLNHLVPNLRSAGRHTLHLLAREIRFGGTQNGWDIE